MSAAIRLSLPALLVLVVLLASPTRGAQLPSSLSGPVLGFVFDSTGGKLRPVRGILGSATVGEPVDTGFGISKVLTLDGRHAIAETDNNADLVLITLDAGKASTMAIPGFPVNPTRGVASLQRTAAAFYYSAPQQIRVVAGLPQDPRHIATFQVNKPITQMAVSDDGALLVFAAGEPDGEAIYTLTDSSPNPRFVTSTLSVSGIVLTRNGDAIVTDRAANEVFAIWDAAGGAQRKLLVDAETVSNPGGVAVSSDNRTYIASGSSVIVLDPGGRYLRSLRCNCSVAGFEPLRESVFRITEGITQTIFLLDAGSAEERILFVPPPLN